MSRVFKGFRAFRAPGLAIAGNASMRGVGTKMGTVFDRSTNVPMSVQVDVGAGMNAGAATESTQDKEWPLRGTGNVKVETVLDLI
jgi:hypothetical protein